MRRTPMARGAGFKRPTYQRAPCSAPTRGRGGVISRVAGTVLAVEKENALQHQGYMKLVRQLPCAHCGIVGHTQFCHADEGKGERIKTDCRRGWPGCGPHGDSMGCHYLLGSTGKLGRAERRRLEALYGAQTRATIIAMGLWPARLPMLEVGP
ncbi:hypothetical protein VCH24_17110 [Variovorax boronicumulans]|nr:hypothetical protein VCH24_17110 [Variovorax boronicumulans]